MTVGLNTADPVQYDEIMQLAATKYPPLAGHQAAVDFVSAALSKGLGAEVTAVQRPGVDVQAVERLAKEIGAGFRARTWHAEQSKA